MQTRRNRKSGTSLPFKRACRATQARSAVRNRLDETRPLPYKLACWWLHNSMCHCVRPTTSDVFAITCKPSTPQQHTKHPRDIHLITYFTVVDAESRLNRAGACWCDSAQHLTSNVEVVNARGAVESLHVSKPVWWLESRFHFSFADHYDANRMNFGPLRVLNDDLVKAHAGFGCA